MNRILLIDTATDTCSAAIGEGNSIIALRESADDRSHAVKLAAFIDELFKEASIEPGQLSAVAISMGPGSYTGLRIGVSMAKGLCYGAGVPLIAVPTLQAMCYGVPKSFLDENNLNDFYYCPMLDARRMEVYTAIYNQLFFECKETSAEIIGLNSFSHFLQEKPVIFFGTGAEKTQEIISAPNAYFFNNFKHSSKNMLSIANLLYSHSSFQNVAYFEPFYLKDFIATVPKNKILS
ncbi:MAG: tRNA (adenosine(37)-N6)-threonylcarbamoyltransferase complex dimerization subunit type 1 TsaB [Bacteroidales bacterium]|nr:tRNA (adenosine(37)-N6)-threonylcarbamoyltransferase complex dimerization subunit type 1 TsaB [Bacteroidales bacterium]